MICARCGKLKADNGIPLCLPCAHKRSGAQLYRLQRKQAEVSARQHSAANRRAKKGLLGLLNRFFGLDKSSD